MAYRKSSRKRRGSLYSQMVAQRKRRELLPNVVMFFVALIPALMLAHVIGLEMAGGAL